MRLAATMLVALSAPAGADIRAHLPTPGDALTVRSVQAEVEFATVYALLDLQGGTVVGLRHTRNAPGIGSYRHRWMFGLEYRRADRWWPGLALHPVSVGYAAGWNDASRNVDGSVVYHRNLPGGRDGDSTALAAARSGAKAGYSLLRYNATVQQALPSAWKLRLVAEGQYSPHLLVPGEQFALGGRYSLRGVEERALTGDRGRRVTVELHTPDVGRRLRPQLSAQGVVFLDRGSVVRQGAPADETNRTAAASVGFGVVLSLPRSWHLSAEVARVRQGAAGDGQRLDHDRCQLSVRWAP